MRLLTLAVHISDSVLRWPWWTSGYVVATVLILIGIRRLRDHEIPRIALITAASFVASMIHIRVGPTSVHLLLNGLVGVILGKRACVAIPVAIVLQAVLLGHGGFQTLGVNAVVITLPALFAGWFFHANRHAPTMGVKEAALAVSYVLHPALLLVLAPLLVIWRRMEKNWNSDGVFRAGFVAGAGAIILTAVLNSAVLVAGGEEDWHVIASLILAAHLPLAIIEGFVVAFAVSFLMSVQPALLRCEQ